MTISSAIVRYHDNVITQIDIHALQNNGWLSDSIIGFALNFFEHDLFESYRHYFEFVGPSVVHLIRMTSEESDLDSVFNSLKLHTKKIAFFPINNHGKINIVGGSHWSLLAFIVDRQLLISFDSMKPINDAISIDFFNRLKRIFPDAEILLNGQCPKQQNTYDCGMYVILICKAICEHVIECDGRIDCLTSLITMLESNVTAELVQQGRQQLFEIIMANSKS
ncbi:hypothetical protein GJ496_003770 [Pomphorhynchus laevis]|nr:hypothetical protein GJ496_003770 [Pomphorhynchus laevis]